MSISPSTRTVLITGCSAGGIGSGLVSTFAAQNYHVFATARTPSKIPSSLTSLSNVTALPLDTSSPSQISAAVKHVESVAGKLDVLVNNSGVGFTQPVLDTDLSDTKRIFDANVYGPLEVIRAFVPLMMRSERAVLVCEGSIAGETYLPYQGVYGASKAALSLLSETLRLELQPLGIRCITVITGITDTNLHANQADDAKLREDSYYTGIGEGLGKMRRREGGGLVPTPIETYSRELVAAVEAGKTGKVYIGTLSWPVFKYFQWWLPTWVWDRVLLGAVPSHEDVRRGLKEKRF